MADAKTYSMGENAKVVIWSGEHFAYWRPNGCGYVTEILGAGVYDRSDAESRISGNGPEKKTQILTFSVTPTKGTVFEATILAAEERGAQRGLLWCCHVRGPDDLYAAESYEAALKQADDLNDALKKHNAGREPHPYDPIISAVPAPWPWDAESHAEDLRKARAHASDPATEAAHG